MWNCKDKVMSNFHKTVKLVYPIYNLSVSNFSIVYNIMTDLYLLPIIYKCHPQLQYFNLNPKTHNLIYLLSINKYPKLLPLD